MNEQEPSAAPHRLRDILIATLALVGLGVLFIWGFIEGRSEAAREAERERPVKPAIEVSRGTAGEPLITLSADLQQQADIRTERPNAAPYEQQVRAYGSVLDLEAFTELSNTIANAKAQLAIAEAKLAASQAAFRRARTLHDNGQVVSTAQLETTEATSRSDEASVKGAQVKTQNETATAYHMWGPVLGQSLVDDTSLARGLVGRKSVLVQVTLPLGVSVPQPPQTAAIETSTGQRIKIDFVSPATRTDPKIQGISFFYTADAASGALPGMNVIARLPTGHRTQGIAVPAPSVVWLQGRAWVYVERSANVFTRRQIPTTEPQPGGGYVVPVAGATERPEVGARVLDGAAQGLPTDQPIVVSGAQALLSQEFSAQIQVGTD